MAYKIPYPTMNWEADDAGEALALFRQKMELYFDDEEITDKKIQARKICRSIGDEGLKKLNASGLSEDDKKNPEKLWELFENMLRIKVNFRIHRLQLMQYRQKDDESIDEFVTRARTLARKCEFTNEELEERILELIIASTPYEQLRRDLLSKEKNFPLKDTLALARTYEAYKVGNEQIAKLGQTHTPTSNVDPLQKTCRQCNRSHPPRRCPAYYSTCNKCGNRGHFAICCNKQRNRRPEEKPNQRGKWYNTDHKEPRDTRYKKSPKRKVHSIQQQHVENESENESGSDDPYLQAFYDVIEISNKRDVAFVTLDVKIPEIKGTHKLRLKIDTGASGNTLPIRIVKQMYGHLDEERMRPVTDVVLTAYNGKQIPCIGAISLKCRYKDNWEDMEFYVVDVEGPAIVGLPSSEKLGLVTIHVDSLLKANNQDNDTQCKTKLTVEKLQKLYPSQFDTIGNFKEKAKLILKEDAEPFIDHPRKFAIHIKEDLKCELDKMERDGIIRKIQGHTDWCSSLTLPRKKDGSIRVCLDPQKLNMNLKRCPYKIPTLEEINPALSKAKVFSKLDAKAGYWSVQLEEDSQPLTTFRTPFGRYCWKRLPFGLRVSQDIFQARMDEILEGLSGVVGIADDVAVFGATEAEHNHNLLKLMERAKQEGLVFNSTKCSIGNNKISFFGNEYTSEGICPDPKKIEAITQIPTPRNKEDLQRFLGLMTYLSQFIPRFSEQAHCLRDLLKKEVPWHWDADHQECFERLKESVLTTHTLQFYNAAQPVDLEVDASMKGLGAALVQGGKPVAFHSRSLTDCQSRYSNIEREMLAIVSGVQRFHTYLYGRPFNIITDHKPLVTICKNHYLQRHRDCNECFCKSRDIISTSNTGREKK